MRLAIVTLVLLATTSTACRDKDVEVERWFADKLDHGEQPFCTEVSALDPRHVLGLRLIRGRGISTAQLRQLLRDARASLLPYGVELVAASATLTSVDVGSLFAATAKQVEAEPAALSRTLKAVLAQHAAPKRAGVALVLLDRVVSERSPLAAHLRHVAGLTLSPLLRDAAAEATALATEWGLQAHGPVVFLSARELAGRTDAERGQAIAHELGHALGLAHVADTKNTMAPARTKACTATFLPPQLQAMEKGIAALASGDR